MTTENQRWQDLSLQASKVFTPTSPIDERELFAGREEQVRLIVDVVNQKGQHGLLFGDRGVGKTSLASVLASFLLAEVPILAPRVNCDTTDTFDTVWRKAFESIELTRNNVSPMGFSKDAGQTTSKFSGWIGEALITPDMVRRALITLAQEALPILIFDEFDRLSGAPRRAFADTIKMLSDHAVAATVILVGVADSVEQLIDEHKSVERALVQIRMPRMSMVEIRSIITTGAGRLGMTASPVAVSRIAKLAQGLPHYAHLLGLNAARTTIDGHRMEILPEDVQVATTRAINGAQQSIRSAYDFAVRSTRKENLFADVLLACAMAETNELGYFAAQDVREPIRTVTGKNYEIPSFAQHLNEFCDQKRGPIMIKDGTRRRFRYRFIDPLLQPFVIMRGIEGGKIKMDALD